jgi:lipoate---protein ligase
MNATYDTFMLWRNDLAIVIGKHQSAAREVNQRLISDLGIPVIRRITGGGTVFHDTGNINFSFIRLNRKENPIDFKFFTQPVIIFLKSMGIQAEFEAKSNISSQGRKISGNSAHVYRGRVLHHGTLLYNTDLEMLHQVINPGEDRYNDRSVRSVKRDVVNIATLIPGSMSAEDFIDSFFSFIINLYDDAYHDCLTEIEIRDIEALAEIKYKDPNWNVGYSPDYQFSDSWDTGEGPFRLSFSTKEAVIESIRIEGPEEYSRFLQKVGNSLPGVLHEKNSVLSQLKSLTFANEKESSLLNQIIEHLF